MFTDTQPIWLQISNPKPYPLLWANRHQLWKPKKLQAILGVYYDGATAKPLVIDIEGEDTKHTNGGWFGSPGAGKSTDMHAALCSILENTAPTILRVWGIDLKKDVFSEYACLPHLADHTGKIERALEILELFANWCRAGNEPTDGIYRLLIVDEFQDLLTHAKYGKVALELINEILSKGREAGIRVWMATQNPDDKCFPSGLKPKTHFMACCHILNDNYVRGELGIYGASKIVMQEELIFVQEATRRVAMFYFTKQDRWAMIESLVQKWGVAVFTPPPMRVAASVAAPVAMIEPVANVAVPSVTPIAPPTPALNPAYHKWNLLHRALTPAEEDTIIQMVLDADPVTEQFHYRGKPTINKVIKHVYAGAKNEEKIAWIKGALSKGGLLEATDE